MATQNNDMVQRSQKQLERNAQQRAEHVSDQPRVAPPVDVYENQDELLLVADLPGVQREGLDIRLDGGELTVEARQQEQEDLEGFRPLLFARTFTLPNTVDADGVDAELNAGVLTVRLPKSEAAKPRRISIKSG